MRGSLLGCREATLLGLGDVDGDGRAEVFAEADARTGALYVLDGCRVQCVTSGASRSASRCSGGPLFCRRDGVLEQLRPTQGAETAQGDLTTRTYRGRDGEVVDEGEQMTKGTAPDADLAKFQVVCE